MCFEMWGTENHHGVVLKLCCCLEVRCSDGAELHITICCRLLRIRVQELPEVRADANGAAFRGWTVLVSGADSFLSTAAKHVLHVKCLRNTMRCWDCMKYLECLQAAPVLKERLASNSSGIKQIHLPSVPHISKCLSVPGKVCVS